MSEFSPAAVIAHPSGTHNVGYDSAFPFWVTGSTNPPVQNVAGTVTAVITGTLQTSLTGTSVITGSVSLSQPATVIVQSQPNITGAVHVTNAVIPVNGTVTAVITGTVQTSLTGTSVITGSVALSQPADVNVLTLPNITGSVNVTNSVFPVTGTIKADITGTVNTNVTNFPAVQTITGTVALTAQPIQITTTGSLPVLGTVTAIITGTVQTSLTGTSVITGSVAVNNVVVMTGSVAVTGSVAITEAIRLVSGSVSRPLFVEPTGGRINILNGATVTTSGSTVLTWQGWSEWYLTMLVSGSVAGTNPQLQFTVSELDPIDKVTVIGRVTTGSILSASGQYSILEVSDTQVDTFKISWMVTGSGPIFSGVNVAWMGHAAGNAIEGQTDVGEVIQGAPLPIGGVDAEARVRYITVDASGRVLVAESSANAQTKGFSDGKAVLAATAVVAIRSTTYTEQSTNAQRSVVSTSANDDAGNTGARTIRLTYYDQDCNGPYTEDITMDGTTPVNTVASNICYIEKIQVLTVGSNASNVGVINLKAAAGGGGATVWSIAVGENKTFGAHHYVAAGKTAFVTGLTAGIKGADTTSMFLRAVPIPTGSNAEIQISDLMRVPSSGQSVRTYSTPIEISGSARVTAYAAPDSSSSRTYYASFDFYEE